MELCSHTCRLTNSWKAWSMAERLWSSRDLNFIFSTSLNVSNTTARSWRRDRDVDSAVRQMQYFWCTTRDVLEERRISIPGSWWSRALWRGKLWRRHRTSGSWSRLASSHQGNYEKEKPEDKKNVWSALRVKKKTLWDLKDWSVCALLYLLSCGQQHKKTDKAVFQSVEVLQRGERV